MAFDLSNRKFWEKFFILIFILCVIFSFVIVFLVGKKDDLNLIKQRKQWTVNLTELNFDFNPPFPQPIKIPQILIMSGNYKPNCKFYLVWLGSEISPLYFCFLKNLLKTVDDNVCIISDYLEFKRDSIYSERIIHIVPNFKLVLEDLYCSHRYEEIISNPKKTSGEFPRFYRNVHQSDIIRFFFSRYLNATYIDFDFWLLKKPPLFPFFSYHTKNFFWKYPPISINIFNLYDTQFNEDFLGDVCRTYNKNTWSSLGVLASKTMYKLWSYKMKKKVYEEELTGYSASVFFGYKYSLFSYARDTSDVEFCVMLKYLETKELIGIHVGGRVMNNWPPKTSILFYFLKQQGFHDFESCLEGFFQK